MSTRSVTYLPTPSYRSPNLPTSTLCSSLRRTLIKPTFQKGRVFSCPQGHRGRPGLQGAGGGEGGPGTKMGGRGTGVGGRGSSVSGRGTGVGRRGSLAPGGTAHRQVLPPSPLTSAPWQALHEVHAVQRQPWHQAPHPGAVLDAPAAEGGVHPAPEGPAQGHAGPAPGPVSGRPGPAASLEGRSGWGLLSPAKPHPSLPSLSCS